MPAVLLVLLCAALVHADVYMHAPRGSNNRLDDENRDRDNANRLFDSQNNNRGGYNVGSVYFYTNSEMPVEWCVSACPLLLCACQCLTPVPVGRRFAGPTSTLAATRTTSARS